MTNEEAIIILRDTPIDIRSSDDIYTLYATAQDMAINALEKQTPKKPYWEYGVWHCKSCGFDVFRDDFFCPICGQEIDWEDDE